MQKKHVVVALQPLNMADCLATSYVEFFRCQLLVRVGFEVIGTNRFLPFVIVFCLRFRVKLLFA